MDGNWICRLMQSQSDFPSWLCAVSSYRDRFIKGKMKGCQRHHGYKISPLFNPPQNEISIIKESFYASGFPSTCHNSCQANTKYSGTWWIVTADLCQCAWAIHRKINQNWCSDGRISNPKMNLLNLTLMAPVCFLSGMSSICGKLNTQGRRLLK